MDETLIYKMGTIESVFGEQRKLTPQPQEIISLGDGDVFKTDDGEVIYLELILNDFTVDELVRITNIAEKLYSKYDSRCYCYVLCMGQVTVNEMPIPSEAEFTIKLAKSEASPCDVILNRIKYKIRNNELLDEEDIQALHMLPHICPPSEKDDYRKLVFSIMSELGL